MIGLAISAVHAGAHDDAREFEAGFAEGDAFEGIEFSDCSMGLRGDLPRQRHCADGES